MKWGQTLNLGLLPLGIELVNSRTDLLQTLGGRSKKPESADFSNCCIDVAGDHHLALQAGENLTGSVFRFPKIPKQQLGLFGRHGCSVVWVLL